MVLMVRCAVSLGGLDSSNKGAYRTRASKRTGRRGPVGRRRGPAARSVRRCGFLGPHSGLRSGATSFEGRRERTGRHQVSEEQAQAGGVRSVRRAFDILTLLTEDRPVITLREITESTGLAKTTALRLVQTLEETGLLGSHPSGYTAGPALWRWAHLARSQWEVPQETRKVMRDLADRLGETVNLFVARGVHRICVAHEESPHPLRHVVDVGDEQPLW